MLKVALDARLIGGTSTGDSTYWTGLLQGLVPQSSANKIYLISDKPRPQNIPWAEDFEWIEVHARHSRLWSLLTLPRTAEQLGCQIVHGQYSMSPLIRRSVATIHDVSFFVGPDWFKPKDRLILQRSIPATVKRARAICTVSDSSKREIEHYMPYAAGKVEVTYNACPSWVSPIPKQEAQKFVEEKFGVAGAYALTVSTRWPRKNMDLAVQAFDKLPASIPHKLLLTGKHGWGDEGLGSRGVALGYVDQSDLSALYSGADMYICPSRHEGFGIPLVEAFKCGCPVICSTGGALPEVAGDAACVVSSWEANEWAQSIQQILGDSSKMEAMRTKGFQRERDFTWEATAKKTLDIYERAASD